MKIGKSTFLLACCLILLFGCTSKRNPVGSDWSHIRPLQTIMRDSVFTDQYSYNSGLKLTGNEIKLIVGKYEQKETKALIQFSSFPDSIYQIIGTPKLRLVIGRRFSSSTMALHFDKVAQNWSESQATWTQAYTDTTWTGSHFVASGIPDFNDIPDTIAVGGDTLHIDIPNSSILTWQVAHVNGYSLLLSTEQSNYLEIKSAESAYPPELVFSYKRTAADTTTYTYDRYASTDTFILNDANPQLTYDGLFLKNISPTRIYLKFDVPASLFHYGDEDSTALSNADFKRMTINKAMLVLKVKDNPYFGAGSTMLASVYRVMTPVDHEVIPNDDMEFITYTPITTGTPGTGTISLNFTPVLQAFTAGVKVNNGIIIRLSTESQDYAKVEFYGTDDPDTLKRPYISVVYTPPAF